MDPGPAARALINQEQEYNGAHSCATHQLPPNMIKCDVCQAARIPRTAMPHFTRGGGLMQIKKGVGRSGFPDQCLRIGMRDALRLAASPSGQALGAAAPAGNAKKRVAET
jgi:hypothetical protein